MPFLSSKSFLRTFDSPSSVVLSLLVVVPLMCPSLRHLSKRRGVSMNWTGTLLNVPKTKESNESPKSRIRCSDSLDLVYGLCAIQRVLLHSWKRGAKWHLIIWPQITPLRLILQLSLMRATILDACYLVEEIQLLSSIEGEHPPLGLGFCE